MLKINQLDFSYSEASFIESLSLLISDGSYVGIIGPNGSGKSTLIKLMAGILKPVNGSILINDQKTTKLDRKHFARTLAYVPQNVDMSFNFAVQDVVAMGRFPHEENLFTKDEDSKKLVDQALAITGLIPLKNRNFSELSGGEKQRTIIASALVQQTNLLLLDEPTSALDLKHQQEIYRLLKQLGEDEGKTVVTVTHDINLAAQYCDRLILLNNGKIVRDGTPEEVLKFPIIEEVYGVKVYIDINPFTKSIYILPYDYDKNGS
ncbi:MAG: heme ABC transporter ATP-binding protein [Calditrichaeota bacterium]|nr:MAG: heme ABC transporter ATP-binding protein [Calditrichota bacterium]MBL1206531.1 heme ABC transporter ATP-binding protein [Calditrichota bacterium]NOG46358.1 heme ABC transporter ATP-binding protein [Calditrichota bacterium]